MADVQGAGQYPSRLIEEVCCCRGTCTRSNLGICTVQLPCASRSPSQGAQPRPCQKPCPGARSCAYAGQVGGQAA